MKTKDALTFFQGEVDRAVVEARKALGQLAQDRRVSSLGAGLIGLIDKLTFNVSAEEGDSSFTLDESAKTMTFRMAPLAKSWNAIYELADEIGLSGDEIHRAQQAGINQLVIHDLLHVQQKVSKFSTIPIIKDGLPGIGLSMIDLAADMIAAWIEALIECQRLDETSEHDILFHFSNALLRAYVIGSFVFDSRTNPTKRQRAIGLVISIVLVQAKIDGHLVAEEINSEWDEISPVLAHDILKAKRFNAIVIGRMPGLLIEDHDVRDGSLLEELWDQVGQKPVRRILELVSMFLKASGAIIVR